MNKKKMMLCGGLICLLAMLLSCGKVTQITKDKEESPSFDLSYSVQAVSTSNAGLRALSAKPHAQDLSVLDDTVYVQVLGIKELGQKDELSWGKAVITLDKKAMYAAAEKAEKQRKEAEKKAKNDKGDKGDKSFGTGLLGKKSVAAPDNSKKSGVIYKSTAYRKDGIKLEVSDFTWSKLSYDSAKMEWKGQSKKIKREYPVYRVAVYTKGGKYFFKLLTKESVGEKTSYDIGKITDYDTFISGLFMQDLAKSKTGLKDSLNLTQLNRLFTAKFFEALSFKKPKNKIKKFSEKRPIFNIESELKTLCLDVANLVESKELEEAKGLLKKRYKKVMSKKAYSELVEAIDAFFDEKKSSASNKGKATKAS